ncbi:hypothetical protein HDU76_011807, partial [Blyttiomyces sp. JEL0837]
RPRHLNIDIDLSDPLALVQNPNATADLDSVDDITDAISIPNSITSTPSIPLAPSFAISTAPATVANPWDAEPQSQQSQTPVEVPPFNVMRGGLDAVMGTSGSLPSSSANSSRLLMTRDASPSPLNSRSRSRSRSVQPNRPFHVGPSPLLAKASPTKLNPDLVRLIVERLLDIPPVDPPLQEMEQVQEVLKKEAVKAAFGSKKGNRHSGIALAEYSGLGLPPFHDQIDHIIHAITRSKKAKRPLIVEGPVGLGKGTALQQLVSEEGCRRPAIYLQLSGALGKRHGAGSWVVRDEDDEFYTETEGETTGGEGDGDEEGEGGEASNEGDDDEDEDISDAAHAIRRCAWMRAVEKSFGVADDVVESFKKPSREPESEGHFRRRPRNILADMTYLDHVAQALRLIASRSSEGPTLIVIDDIQLLFRGSKSPLVDKYDGIEEVFAWLLACETEGILEVVLSTSEKSAVKAVKRLRGYDWALTLHSVDSVDDDIVIAYLLRDVNPRILNPARQFTEETATLFVTTFDGSLLEINNYFRDMNCDVQSYIAKRERAFLRHLQRHLPTRHNVSTTSSKTPLDIPLPYQNRMTSTSQPSFTITDPAFSTSSLSSFNPYSQSTLQSHKPSDGDLELRELFLSMIVRGGVLPVAQLDSNKLELVEVLMERNILRWRDRRARRRELWKTVGRRVGGGEGANEGGVAGLEREGGRPSSKKWGSIGASVASVRSPSTAAWAGGNGDDADADDGEVVGEWEGEASMVIVRDEEVEDADERGRGRRRGGRNSTGNGFWNGQGGWGGSGDGRDLETDMDIQSLSFSMVSVGGGIGTGPSTSPVHNGYGSAMSSVLLGEADGPVLESAGSLSADALPRDSNDPWASLEPSIKTPTAENVRPDFNITTTVTTTTTTNTSIIASNENASGSWFSATATATATWVAAASGAAASAASAAAGAVGTIVPSTFTATLRSTSQAGSNDELIEDGSTRNRAEESDEDVDEDLNGVVPADLDTAEQLALFAREGAELVWANSLVRTVCEGFVNGTQLLW